jgi:hypothetical protein
MSLTNIGKDPRSLIYKFLNNFDLCALRCTSRLIRGEIKPTILTIREIYEVNEIERYLNPNSKIAINVIKYMIDQDCYYKIEKFAHCHFSKYQLIPQSWKYEIIDYANANNKKHIYSLLRDIWIKRENIYTASIYIVATAGFAFSLFLCIKND